MIQCIYEAYFIIWNKCLNIQIFVLFNTTRDLKPPFFITSAGLEIAVGHFLPILGFGQPKLIW